MKIGIPALIFQLEEAISICKSNKYLNHIEVGIDNIEDCEVLNKYIDEIKENNITIGIHLPMELNTCENITYIRQSWIEFVEEIKINLKQINIEYFNFHLGYVISNRYKVNSNKYLDNSIEFINKLSKSIHNDLFIENTYSHGGDICNVGTLTDEFEYIFNNVNTELLGFCYDTGHNLINYDDYLNKLGRQINLVHLSDNDGKKDSHIGIGKGILKLNELKKVFKYNPKTIILEVAYSELFCSLESIKDFID